MNEHPQDILDTPDISPQEQNDIWDDATLDTLNDNIHLEATQDIISQISSQSPLFLKDLHETQNWIGEALDTQLRNADMIDYFQLNQRSITRLHMQLSEIGLDIFQLLSSLQEDIENKLSQLSNTQQEKIKVSIGKKINNIYTSVSEMAFKSHSSEEFKNNRWILDDTIGETFNFYTAELFPSLEVKLALAKGDTVPDTYTQRYEERTLKSGATYKTYNPQYIDVENYMGEIDELLNASLDEEGNFDEGFFSTQNLLEKENENHVALFQDMGIDATEGVSLLNEKDKQIEEDAMIAYFILIGIQMVPYLGAPISLWVDGVDAFSDHDGTLLLGKSLWLIHEDFKMEKQWYDNALWGVGLALTAVGLQGIAKGKKLADSFVSLEKIDFWRIEEILQTLWGKLWISQEKLQDIGEYLRDLLNWNLEEIDRTDDVGEYFKDMQSFIDDGDDYIAN